MTYERTWTTRRIIRSPTGPLVVFMYNPFVRVVLNRVLANLTRSHREQPRDILVIYCLLTTCNLHHYIPGSGPVRPARVRPRRRYAGRPGDHGLSTPRLHHLPGHLMTGPSYTGWVGLLSVSDEAIDWLGRGSSGKYRLT